MIRRAAAARRNSRQAAYSSCSWVDLGARFIAFVACSRSRAACRRRASSIIFLAPSALLSIYGRLGSAPKWGQIAILAYETPSLVGEEELDGGGRIVREKVRDAAA